LLLVAGDIHLDGEFGAAIGLTEKIILEGSWAF